MILQFYEENLDICWPNEAFNDEFKFVPNFIYYYYNLEKPPAYITYYLLCKHYKKYTFNEFITDKYSIHCTQKGYLNIPIIFFKNKKECDKFLNYLINQQDLFIKYLKEYNNTQHKYIDDKKRIVDENNYKLAMFAYWAYEEYYNSYIGIRH